VRSDAVVVARKVDDLWAELSAVKNQMDQQQNQSVLQAHIESLLVAIDSIPHKPTAAEAVAAAVKSGSLTATNVRRATKVVYGKAAINKLQTAKMKKFFHLFVTRLDPDTTCDDITNCVIDSVSESLDVALDKDSIKCEQLKTV